MMAIHLHRRLATNIRFLALPRTSSGRSDRAGIRREIPRSELHQGLLVSANAAAAVIAVALAGGSAAGAVAFVAAAVGVDLFTRDRAVRLDPSVLDDAPSVAARGLVIAAATTAIGLPIFGGTAPGVGLVVTTLLYTVTAVTGLGVGYSALRRLRSDGRLASRALIVGAGRTGAKIGWRLRDHPEYGLVPYGFVDRVDREPAHELPAPVVADVTDLPKTIVEHDIQHVFVASCRSPDADLVDVLRACDRATCEVHVVPRLYELGVGGFSTVEHLWGIPLIRLRRAPFRCRSWTLKRALDVVLAGLGLIAAAPLMLAIVAALRHEVGPGVLFRQTRVGLDGRPFRLLKFRTLAPAPAGASDRWSEVDDGRIGPVGRFLRRSSLDELPQLWNVLRGDMSLVGPRPEQPHYSAGFARSYPRYADRLRAPVGLTGWAQIHGLRGATSIEDRVCFDNFCIEHWSLWQDIKILIRTAASVVRMRGG
jgi:exopolysaccharide biosynthesis polyprenyl glycosylphosphotransferase